MKVMILGIDGYLGWPLALHLARKGHEVSGIDNFSRRYNVKKVGGDSLTHIASNGKRNSILTSICQNYMFSYCNVRDARDFIGHVKPNAIVHLAEQPSAPYSMRGPQEAMETQYRNVIDTLGLLWWIKMHCPSAHLIKLGTMGEYGTPPCDIPEGQIPDMCISGNDALCKMAGLQFPRSAGSFYHISKVHDSHNIEFACRNWNLCSTDIMQGPVFGVKTADMDDIDQITRFDYDELFGTVINRFCAQAISNHPLTIYGAGRQERGYIPIQESIECMTLAIENPPKPGEYRVFNQFARTYTINELAETVQIAASHHDLDVVIAHYENPRKELESHYYNPANKKLRDLGYKPTSDIIADVYNLIGDILPYKDSVNKDVIMPFTRWDTKHRVSKII